MAFDYDDYLDSEPIVARNGVDLSNMGEELQRRKLEIGAKERKFEETIEYQRRTKNEAK